MRLDFLDWRPDLETYDNQGLQQADNVLHDVDGYKPVRSLTTGSMATAIAGGGGTVKSVQVRPQGSLREATSTSLVYGIAEVEGSGTLRAAAGPVVNNALEMGTKGAVATATSGVVTGFQMCELNEDLFVTLQVAGEAQSGTAISLNQTGYADIV